MTCDVNEKLWKITNIETTNKVISEKRVDINLCHEQLGHVHESMLIRTAKSMGVTLTGELRPCIHCALAKAKQKNVNKLDTHRATTTGARIHTDISSVQHTSVGGANYWILVVDQCTRKKWNRFVKHKSMMCEKMWKS